MFRAGAAEADITPAFGIQLGGDIGRPRLLHVDSERTSHQIACPRKRDNGSGNDDENQRNHAPECEHVVPVEIARAAAESAPEKCPQSDLTACSEARQPQVDATQRQEQEQQVGDSDDGRAVSRRVSSTANQRCQDSMAR